MTAQIAAWVFPALVLFAMVLVWRFDRDPTTTWRAVQLISDADGHANSGSLAYVSALLVGTWLIYHEAIQGRLTEGLFGLYLGTFVAGQVIRSGIGAAQRVGEAKANRPASDVPPRAETTTTTTTTETD